MRDGDFAASITTTIVPGTDTSTTFNTEANPFRFNVGTVLLSMATRLNHTKQVLIVGRFAMPAVVCSHVETRIIGGQKGFRLVGFW